jgi:signal transduction histidine kinase
MKIRVDMISRGMQSPDELAAELANVAEEIARLDRLAKDLLTVSARRIGPREDSSLHALIARRVSLMQPTAEARNVQISVRGEARAKIDPDALARVADNLLQNAIEASPPSARVDVEISEADEVARVRVIDQGNGVSPNRAGELFELFFTTKPEGVGLGLALSRAIVLAHGGRLEYVREGSMTAFVVTLPRDWETTG